MAEVLGEFTDLVVGAEDGVSYTARACGRQLLDGMWEGWIEFRPVDGGLPLRTGRETTQPNHRDAMYWASGLTAVYLEGALSRALHGPINRIVEPPPRPAFSQPAPDLTTQSRSESILDPFSIYRKGEDLLRRQLHALSEWHLVNIIRAYSLSAADPDTLRGMTPAVLVELIVGAVREQVSARQR